MRVSGIEEYATLVRASAARLHDKTCTAPAGSTVRIVAYLNNPSGPLPDIRVFARLVDGACAGHELTLDTRELVDFRATPAATPPPVP